MKPISLPGVTLGSGPLTLIAGPCMAESLDLCMEVGERVAEAARVYGFQYIFKASYDKANRTGIASQRGPGIGAGLEILSAVKSKVGAPATTDIHSPQEAEIAAAHADLLQIPAFLCRQSDLLEAAAKTGKPVNVKKGQFLAPWDTKNIVEKLEAFGASGAMLTERGTSFGYNTLIVDMPGLEIMRGFGVPVCMDATHAAQRPGGAGSTTGGNRDSIPAMARAAVAVGVDALFMEVHPNPERALSDAATQWPLSRLDEILEPIAKIAALRA